MLLALDYEKLLTTIKHSQLDIELDYLRSAIEILVTNYTKDFQEKDREFEKEIAKLKSSGEYDLIDEDAGCTSGEIAEVHLQGLFEELESFSSIIIESMIIKHAAFIEKLVIEYSYLVQRKEYCQIPPYFPLSENDKNRFTDMDAAARYIQIVTNKKLQFTQLKSWKNIKNLRELRHKLAHGERYFSLKEGKIDDINKNFPGLVNKRKLNIKTYNKENPGDRLDNIGYAEFQSKTLIRNPKNEWECTIGVDINTLTYVNKICKKFSDEAKTSFYKRYHNEKS